MRTLLLLAFALGSMSLSSCTSDPDLDPKPTGPQSNLSPLPHNRPIAGQGGGALGALPQQPRR